MIGALAATLKGKNSLAARAAKSAERNKNRKWDRAT